MLLFYNRRRAFQVVFMMKTNFWGTQTQLLNGTKRYLFWFHKWNNQIYKYLVVL